MSAAKIKIEDLLQFNFLSDVAFSPHGEKIAFLVKRAREEENDYGSNIWLYDLEEERLFQLTTGKEDGPFAWAEDGEKIFFVSGRDLTEEDKEKGTEGGLFSIAVDGGEAKELTSLHHKVEDLRVKENVLMYSALVEVEENCEEEDELGNYEALDEIPFWYNGKGFTNKKRHHLFALALDEQTKEPRNLTPGTMDVSSFDTLEDGVIFVASEYEDKKPIYNDIYIGDLNQESSPEKLTGDYEMSFGLAHFLDEETIVASGTDMEEAGINQNKSLFKLDPSKEKLTPLAEGLDNSFYNSVLTDVKLGAGPTWRTEGGELYFITTEGHGVKLNKVTKEGERETLLTERGSIDSYDVQGGKIAYVALKGETLQELYLEEGSGEKRLTQFNEGAVLTEGLSEPESFAVERDGEKIDAWIIRPPQFDPEKQYPAILEVHGGPKAVYGEVFFHEMQVFASAGYCVIFSNPHGSDGKGDEFADIRGDYGGRDFEDLMAVTDEATRRFDFIDEDRLGVTGGSYGGFMTNWIIGHTDRFNAAASQRSIANWISKFNTTDIGYFFVEDQQKGNPWENHDRLWRQSPLKYAHSVSTPTLFIHSEQDYRCWMAEGLQMFTALKYFGVPAKLCLFKEENHELSRGGKPENRMARLKEMVDWFDRHISGT